jgi:hypothetical protein
MIVACALVGLPLAAACAPARREAAPDPVTSLPSAAGFSPEVQQSVARLREATTSFRDLDAAVTAGYARDVPQCVEHPPHGAMGFHHVNRGYVDTRIEVEHPEILTYERASDGRYALTGAEYIIPYRLWPADSTPPVAFGRDLKRADGLQLWYLHVWVWKENPSGLFADWNPAVRCPQG